MPNKNNPFPFHGTALTHPSYLVKHFIEKVQNNEQPR